MDEQVVAHGRSGAPHDGDEAKEMVLVRRGSEVRPDGEMVLLHQPLLVTLTVGIQESFV